ncbi:MAG TPA: hypothetical protein VMG38_19900 [Trebonia sp.]|nr:hypothetical protein [Trebonia sp.]
MKARLAARASRLSRLLSRLPRCVLMLSLLAVAACSRSSPPRLCPQFQTVSGVTVNASQFFAGHGSAHELCVTGTPCLVRPPGQGAVGAFVATGTATAVTIEVTVLAGDGTALLGKSVRVTLTRRAARARTATCTAR